MIITLFLAKAQAVVVMQAVASASHCYYTALILIDDMSIITLN